MKLAMSGEMAASASIRRLRGDLEGDNLDEDLEDDEDLDPANDPSSAIPPIRRLER